MSERGCEHLLADVALDGPAARLGAVQRQLVGVGEGDPALGAPRLIGGGEIGVGGGAVTENNGFEVTNVQAQKE